MLGIALQSLEVPRTPTGPSTVISLHLPLDLGNIDMVLDIPTLDGPRSRLEVYHAKLVADSWLPELSCCT